MSLACVVLAASACSSTSEPGSTIAQTQQTDVYLAQLKADGGLEQVVLLTLYPDQSGFVSVKTLGQPPASGRVTEVTWQWRRDPQRLQLTPISDVNEAPIIFVPDGDGLMYVGERLTSKRLLLIRDRN